MINNRKNVGWLKHCRGIIEGHLGKVSLLDELSIQDRSFMTSFPVDCPILFQCQLQYAVIYHYHQLAACMYKKCEDFIKQELARISRL